MCVGIACIAIGRVRFLFKACAYDVIVHGSAVTDGDLHGLWTLYLLAVAQRRLVFIMYGIIIDD